MVELVADPAHDRLVDTPNVLQRVDEVSNGLPQRSCACHCRVRRERLCSANLPTLCRLCRSLIAGHCGFDDETSVATQHEGLSARVPGG